GFCQRSIPPICFPN
nr:Chain B, Trypsin inhibitor 1 [Helianthus annuus]6O21_B Chain B, Trypsin inhibitor 1 [Helianthus annuus]